MKYKIEHLEWARDGEGVEVFLVFKMNEEGAWERLGVTSCQSLGQAKWRINKDKMPKPVYTDYKSTVVYEE